MTRCGLLTVLVIGLCGAHSVHAQQGAVSPQVAPAPTDRIIPGAYTTVQLVNGSRGTGTLVSVSNDQVEITPRTRFPTSARTIAFANIQTIQQGRGDSLVNGALWGGVSSGVGALMVVNAVLGCDGCHWESAAAPLGIMGLFGGIGAGVGAGIDALRGERGRVVYSRPTAHTVGMAPIVGRNRKGVLLSVRF